MSDQNTGPASGATVLACLSAEICGKEQGGDGEREFAPHLFTRLCRVRERDPARKGEHAREQEQGEAAKEIGAWLLGVAKGLELLC